MNFTLDSNFHTQSSQQAYNRTDQSGVPKSDDWHEKSHLAYATILFMIFMLGFVGNVLAVMVFIHPSHRHKTLTPLMINLALAGVFITLFGYPMSFREIVTGTTLETGQTRCSWFGFVNGVVGITSIATFTEMSLVMNYCMHQMSPRFRVSTKLTAYLIAGAWTYGLLSMLPPLLGWNRFVPGNAGVSCGPDWTDRTPSGMAYSLLLVAVGFLVPLCAISVSHLKMYRLLRQNSIPGNSHVRQRRRRWQIKLMRMTAVAMAIFMLSWSPYCFVSLASMFKGNQLMTPGEAEVPELMAKASFAYNPLVYMAMSKRFRNTLRKILTCARCTKWLSENGAQGNNSGVKSQNMVTEEV